MEPLPPVKEVEYRCYIGKVFEELSGSEFMTFAFETAKEFSSFRYEIAVRYRIQPGLLEFKVLGMTATRTMMPAFGTARSVLKVPLLPFGIYTVKLIKSDDTENIFTIEVSKKGFQILLPIPRKRFIDVVIDDNAAVPNGRHLSTVSKAVPVPLVPRTIQKRIPGMMDDETMEDVEVTDDQDDDALFDDAPKPKAAAKHAEEEVPAKTKAKPEPKPAKAEKVKAEKPAAKAKKAEHKPAKAAKKPAAKVVAVKKKAPDKKKPAPKPKPAAKAKPAKKSGKKK